MKPHYFILLLLFLVACRNPQKNLELIIQSSDQTITAKVKLDENGSPFYVVLKNKDTILEPSKLGIIREDADFSGNLKLISISDVQKVSDNYTMLTSKRNNCVYQANNRSLILENDSMQQIEIIFQVSNDGVAFCYRFNEKSDDIKHITEEKTSFNFPEDAKAWLHPQANARTGWCNVEPCYEMHYHQGINVGTPAPFVAGWSFPSLFQSNGVWVLITESGLEPNYCGSRLSSQSPDGEYFITFPQEPERTSPSAALKPQSTLPWQTPWRVIVLGNLNQIVETTLVTDLAQPCAIKDTEFIKPGKASWSWALLKDASVVYDVQKKFIDLASEMGWEYCLIDVEWDKKIGYEKIQDLINYAATKKVGIILWYNSSGSWNTTTYSPKNMMFDPEIRRKEFDRISKMGVKGVKVDFWGGDGQSMIKYYYDLLKDAADYKLLVNCHGATVPRGWDRTYPNLVSMEAVKGFEYITFEQRNADSAATHCAMLPFTRNVVGSMDFTPMCFSEIPGIHRRTSNAFELALSVLFQSGIQHYAAIPEGIHLQPDYVIDFLKSIPDSWDDIKLIDGYPAKYVVLARKSVDGWFVAGINSEKIIKTFELDLSSLKTINKGLLITDGENNRSFSNKEIELIDGKLKINMNPSGGFVLFLKQSSEN